MTGDNTPRLTEEFERMALTIPSIYEDDEQGRRMGYDLFSRLIKDGGVTLEGPVDDRSAAIVSAALLFLDRNFQPKDENDMITLMINYPGGSIVSGLKIYDTMMRMKHPVRTVCSGQASSMGSFLLMAGAPNERYATPNSRIMIHEGAAGKQGKITDMDNIQREFNKTNSRMFAMYEFHTGMDIQTLKSVMEGTDTFMNPEEAKAWGLVDKVGYNPQTFDYGFEDPTAQPAVNDNDPAKAGGEEPELRSKDPSLQAYDQKWLKAVHDWKKDWGKFVESYNKVEAENRHKPQQPTNEINLLELAKKRKVPKFG